MALRIQKEPLEPTRLYCIKTMDVLLFARNRQANASNGKEMSLDDVTIEGALQLEELLSEIQMLVGCWYMEPWSW